jgi:hypothetical protein
MAKRDSVKQRTQPRRSDDFKSVAKRLECDEDKERFEAKLGKLAKAKKPAMPKTKGR